MHDVARDQGQSSRQRTQYVELRVDKANEIFEGFSYVRCDDRLFVG